MEREFTLIIEKGESGDGFYGYCPELPGCTSHGNSVEDLRINMAEAVTLYLEALRDSGESIPDNVQVSRVAVSA